MLNLKKIISLLALLLLHIQSNSQVFPNSPQYKTVQKFFSNNPQNLAKFVSSINIDTYGKCLANVTEWDIAIMSKRIDPDNDFMLGLAVQWVGLIEARKNLMNQGISDNQLNASLKSYQSRLDIGKGGSNFKNWGVECKNIAINSINN
jgi:hypothetical protein